MMIAGEAIPTDRTETANAPLRSRILFIINSLGGGGAERVMMTLLANSKDHADRHDIALAVLDRGPSPFTLPEWLKIYQLDCKESLLSSIRAIELVVREFDPAITVSFLTRANLATSVAMMKRRRPWIISERTSTPAHLGTAFRKFATRALMRLVYPRATHVIAVSKGVAARLASAFGVTQDRIEIIANPVDIGSIEAAARETCELCVDQPYIIAVGRLVSVKNYRLLIQAFASSKLPCRLVIAGEGPERETLRKLAADLGISDRVLMPGWLKNPYPALLGASAFALTSNVEGFPNALVEALALGIPVVATNCVDGPAEIIAGTRVEDVSGLSVARAGILTPTRDVESFARGLKLALEEPLRADLIAEGRKRAEDYRASKIAANYWTVIERALTPSGR